MNSSNRFGMESMARERQAQIERELRKVAQLREPGSPHSSRRIEVKWAAIGATALSVLGTIAFVLISHVR
jgi:hypothetical protein